LEGGKKVFKLLKGLQSFKEFSRLVMQHRMGIAGIILFAIFGFIAIFAPFLRTVDPMRGGLPVNILEPPSSQFWLGTDNLARDVWSQTVYGTRISLTIGFIAAFVTVGIGTLLGLIAGYFRGKIEEVVMRIVEYFMMLPFLPLMLVFTAVMGQNIWNVVLLIGVLAWTGTARIIRSQVLSLRERAFVEASRSVGAGDRLLIFGEIMPNVVPLVFAQGIVLCTWAIYAEATLAFLGLGDPNVMSWGKMLNLAYTSGYLTRAPWWVIPPIACIVLLILAFTFLGTAVSDIMKPGYREARGL